MNLNWGTLGRFPRGDTRVRFSEKESVLCGQEARRADGGNAMAEARRQGAGYMLLRSWCGPCGPGLPLTSLSNAKT